MAAATVIIADIDDEAGYQTALTLGHDSALFVHTDVSDEAQVTALMEKVIADYGRIDYLVNNAGIDYDRPLTELSLADWNRVLGVNLTGAFLCAKHAASALSTAKGAIVNIASTRALQSEPNTEAYSASKGGLLSLTHALAISLGPNVRVNAISPGWIDTRESDKHTAGAPEPLRAIDHEQHPTGRVGRSKDISELAVFLCSPAAEFITGQNFVVDGGMTKRMFYAE